MIDLIYIYKILSIGFSYPDKERWEMAIRYISTIEDLIEGEMAAHLNNLKGHIAQGLDQIEDARMEYISLFDIGRRVSPYETEYIKEKTTRKAYELADIAGFYSAFGFCVRNDVTHKESLDHISVELEFMAAMLWKEEYAREAEDIENLDIMRDARKKFFAEHLGRWGRCFINRIIDISCNRFYMNLSDIFKLVIDLECSQYGINIPCFAEDPCSETGRELMGEDLTCG